MHRRYLLHLIDQGEHRLPRERHVAALDLHTPAGLAVAHTYLETQAHGIARRAGINARQIGRCWLNVVDEETGVVAHVHYPTPHPY